MSDDPVLSVRMSLFLEHCSAAVTVFCRQDLILIYYFIFFSTTQERTSTCAAVCVAGFN